ncbi:MAG TPA: sulfotransferase [Solirubrobacteraceae bacterium]|nr:sulfotransferase [Solirubrobacteraceae bacterium]
MALPTFFIIGAPKAGTTSLHYYLDQHPHIHMSPVKEPHFLIDRDNVPSYVTHHITRLDDYERLFDSTAPARGEASPSYAEYPRHKGAPERISSLVPGAKFIYLVRDPIDRTISHYMHHVAVDGESRSLPEALGDFSDLESPYIGPSLYAFQLDHYLKYFSPQTMLVIDHSDLLDNRFETLREIFGFLDVDQTFSSPRFDDKVGESVEKRIYSQSYMHLAKRLTTSSLRRLPRGLRRSLRRSVERALWPPLERPTLDDNLRGRLEELFTNDVARLRAMTGKRFATWNI